MYYKVQIKRLDASSSKFWSLPYAFKSKKRAVKEAISWDRFYKEKYDGTKVRLWVSKIKQVSKKGKSIIVKNDSDKFK